MGRKRSADDFPAGYAAWLAGLRERVRGLREARGLSVRAAAKKTGVTFVNLNKIETGVTAEPTLASLWLIAAGYGVSLEWLLTGRGKK